ncbi:hypothetical protein B0G38_000002 [Arthrobacter sp. VKM Ac-2550]|nr:hypothetical protein [Arthrobacter sp. VKM Ac-2550]
MPFLVPMLRRNHDIKIRTNTLSIWVHPHTQWSLTYISVHIPPIREQAVERLYRNMAYTGLLLITANRR